MQVFSNKLDLRNFLNSSNTNNKSIGFVPTMGALHDGHLSLLKYSLKENDITLISIFVNPTQFNNLEDLEKYPRTIEKDIEKIKSLSKEIIIYTPEVNDLYEKTITSEKFDFDGLENQMEGKHRPGHFDGVGTVVKKLFSVVKPNRAYFGEKDYQQLLIVKKLASKYKIPVEIIGCPILREENGLAMSSRNQRLSPEARKKSCIIFENLKKAKKNFKTQSAQKTKEFLENEFQKNKMFTLEYFEIADEETLLPCKRKNKTKKYRGFIAVLVENIRLIDNLRF